MTQEKSTDKAQPRKKWRHDIDSHLIKGEEIVAQAVIHPLGIYWKGLVVLVFAIVVALVPFISMLGFLFAFTAVLMLIYATIKKEVLMLVLTNKRMLFRYGILQVDVVDMRFSKIESVELERMPPGYLMGYSNVVIMGTGNRYVVIPYVANGPEIRQAYNRLTLSEDEIDEE